MPIPSYPENRREEYLNNIATGSGEIPPYPENREEQYLDAIARNGGGGSTGGGALVVHVDMQTLTLDKTWQEIVDAYSAGIIPILDMIDEYGAHTMFYLRGYYADEGNSDYGVRFFNVQKGPEGVEGVVLEAFATTANGYPVGDEDGD